MTQAVSLVALALFAVLMVIIGVISSKKSSSMDGFLLGGRNIGAWMSAFAYGTSYFSAVIFVGYAGKHGWDVGVGSIWIGVGNSLIGCLLAWKLMALRVRNMTHALEARTMPEFFAERYQSKAMKLVASVIIFLFLVPYAASVYKGLGSIFGIIFPNAQFIVDDSTIVCMFIVALLTAVYLVMGGYVAIALNDFIQGVIMFGGVVVLIIVVTLNSNVQGFSNLIDKLSEISPSLVSPFGGDNFKFLMTNILLTSVGTFGLPQMVHKFYAVKDEQAIKRATVISTLFAMVIGCGAYYVGTTGRLILGNILPEGGHDAVVPSLLLAALGSSFGGSLLLALILLLVLSASMSTLSSVVLSSSTAITVDFLGAIRSNFKGKIQMTWTKALCIVFVALSFIFATANFAIIVSIMSYSWGVVAGCFIGPFIWGLYSKKITRAGAWAGMFGGFLTVFIMAIVSTIQKMSSSDSLYDAFKAASANSPTFGVCALGVSLVLVPVVSLFTKPLGDKVVNKAFSK